MSRGNSALIAYQRHDIVCVPHTSNGKPGDSGFRIGLDSGLHSLSVWILGSTLVLAQFSESIGF